MSDKRPGISRRTGKALKTAVVVASFAVPALLPAYAAAHVDVSPTRAPAGKATGFSLTVGHGCAGAATNGLTVEVPKAVGRYEVEQLAGWKTSTPEGRMVWRGGPLADGELLGFPFRATLFGEKGDRIPFKVVQSCEGGGEIAWISTGSEGGEGHGTPAPEVTLTSARAKPEPAPETAGGQQEAETPVAGADPAAVPSGDGDEDGGSGIGTFAVIALVAAALTTLVVILRARRSPG